MELAETRHSLTGAIFAGFINPAYGLRTFSKSDFRRINEPPHIHVRCSDGECKFWLEPIGLSSNRGIAPHDLREIERLVFEHKQLLLAKYHEYHPQ